MSERILGALKVTVGVLLAAIIGAVAGSLLLSCVVLGGYCVFRQFFLPNAIRDGQLESWTLMSTIPYGALWGVAGAVTTFVKIRARRQAYSVDSSSSAFAIVTGILIMAFSLAMGYCLPALEVIGIDGWGPTTIGVAFPFLMGAYLTVSRFRA